MALDWAQVLEREVIIQFEMWELQWWGLEAAHGSIYPASLLFLLLSTAKRKNSAIFKTNKLENTE